MIYINALELINACIENEILVEKDGGVFVYRNASANSKEGWYLDDKDILAKEIMADTEAQNALISALKEKGVEFIPTDYSWMQDAIDRFEQI